MQIFREKDALQGAILQKKSEEKSVGFIPTMGALHEGHLSLIKQAALECDQIVVSIFINPTQFDNPQDLKDYPRTLDSDISLLKTLKLDLFLFVPAAGELYGNSIQSEHFEFDGLEYEMEGKFRNGHFDGVGTVVKRLFKIVNPDKAFFGEKDYQQLQIIRSLVNKNKLHVQIVGCSISREKNGLARSSRNERLTSQIRNEASFIYETLLEARKKFGTESAKSITEEVKNKFNAHPFLKLEYFEIANSETLESIQQKIEGTNYRAFIAAYAGEIRLIDNLALN